MKIAFIFNNLNFLFSHRLNYVLACKKAGYEVIVCSPNLKQEKIKEVEEKYGIQLITYCLYRKSLNPFREFRSICSLFRSLNQLKGLKVIHNFTIKPVVYGTLYSLFCRKLAVVNTMTGLGHLFIDTKNKSILLRKLVICFFNLFFKMRHIKINVQNRDDYERFKRYVVDEKHIQLTAGTGVDLAKFSYHDPLASEQVNVMLPARLIYQKGVMELISACDLLYKDSLNFHLILCGELDHGNRSCIREEDFQLIKNKPYVRYLGHVENIEEELIKSHIIAFPSYREGLPLALMEACGIGRPIVCFDVPGCRDIVDEGVNGYKCDFKDHECLYQKLKQLIKSSQERLSFGKASREKAQLLYDETKVAHDLMSMYEARN